MKRIIIVCWLSAMSFNAIAQDSCDIQLMVAPMTQIDNTPQSVCNQLEIRLINAITATGSITVGKDYAQFFVAGRFINSYTQTLPGPPIQTVVKTTLMLYMGDVKHRSVMASESIELKGVGRNEERAMTNALQQIKKGNPTIKDFVERGKNAIISYFDKNYQQYLDSAQRAFNKGHQEEALYYTGMIPACSQGYEKARELTDKIIKKSNTTKSPRAIVQEWNKQQRPSRPVISFIKYK